MEQKLPIRILDRFKSRFEETHRPHVTSRAYWGNILSGLMLLSSTLVLNFYSWKYASDTASNSVTDIVLSNTTPYNVDVVFTYGTFLFVFYIVILCFSYPWKTPFILKSISLFVLVRSISISLTHIGPFSTQIITPSSEFLRNFVFTGDLFFSGHTGLPFLMALIFWKHPFIRNLCITVSIMFGIIVLIGHIHYSIDVFSAFFITHSTHRMSAVFFRRDAVVADGG